MRALTIFLLFALLGAGCETARRSPAPARVTTDAAPAIAEGAAKDAAISTEAQGIAENSTDSAFVAASAARILDVLRLSPWAKTEATIRALVSERDAARKETDAAGRIIAEKDEQIAKLQKEVRELRDAFHNWFRRGCYVVGTLVMALGVASFFFLGQIASLSPWLAARMGPMISVSVFAFGATLLSTGIAYGWALENKVIVACALGAAGLAAVIYFHGNHHREKTSHASP
jgi:hypothetical protein